MLAYAYKYMSAEAAIWIRLAYLLLCSIITNKNYLLIGSVKKLTIFMVILNIRLKYKTCFHLIYKIYYILNQSQSVCRMNCPHLRHSNKYPCRLPPISKSSIYSFTESSSLSEDIIILSNIFLSFNSLYPT